MVKDNLLNIRNIIFHMGYINMELHVIMCTGKLINSELIRRTTDIFSFSFPINIVCVNTVMHRQMYSTVIKFRRYFLSPLFVFYITFIRMISPNRSRHRIMHGTLNHHRTREDTAHRLTAAW